MRTKKPLFQWDINQKFINCTGQYIDFIFDNDPQPYRVEIKDGACLIPDEFLQTEGKKTVYECLSDGTITENKLTVHGRPKPPNYVYTTTEKLTFDGLVQKVDDTVNDIINRANSGEFNGTSVTHMWEGTTLIITSASGTSSIDLKGEKGDTPKKGVDYYTENEIEGIIENITSGSIGKFKQTVEDETSTFNANSDNKLSAFNKNASDKTIELNNNANSRLEEYNINSENKFKEFNDNSIDKTKLFNDNSSTQLSEFNLNVTNKVNTFNTNYENKLNSYNSNAANKIDEYNNNAIDTITEFNTSADTKISEYNSNAESKVAEYNQNDTNKTAEYNSNAKIKFDEYNTNADNKVAEFDSHTEQLQTDINELKNDLGDIETELGVYKPLSASGKTLANSNVKIVENVRLKKGVTYTYSCNLNPYCDIPSYVGLWCDSVSDAYLSVITIPANSTDAVSRSFKWIYDDTDSAYFTINASGRTVSWELLVTDDTDHASRFGKVESVTKELKERANSDCVYGKVTTDLSNILKYTDRADSYADSESISVVYGDNVRTYNQYTPYRQVNVYNGENLIDTADNVFEYTVTDAMATKIILTVYKNQKGLEDTVIFTHSDLKPIAKTEPNYAIRQPRVTFIDDDGNVEFYDYLLPKMRLHNIPMVSAYMGDSNTDMSSNAAMMNLAQCKAVVDAGGEIIVHYNPDLRTLSLDEAERIVLKSKNVLKKYGFDSDLVAYSNGTCSPEIRAMIAKHFKAGFTGAYPRVSDTDRSNHGCIPQYFIHREPCGGLFYDQSAETRSYSYFKNMVDECIANNGWLVFTLHSWLMPEGKKKQEYADVDQLELLSQIIEYIKSRESDSGIKIVTASEGLEMFGNLMQSGDYMGHWNEMILTPEESTMMGGHDDAGCAINKVGQYDFPTSKKVTH